jgi:hypothetical protein
MYLQLKGGSRVDQAQQQPHGQAARDEHCETRLIRRWSSLRGVDGVIEGIGADFEMGSSASEESFMRCELCFQMMDLSGLGELLGNLSSFRAMAVFVMDIYRMGFQDWTFG